MTLGVALAASGEQKASWELATCKADPLIVAWKATVEQGCKVKAVEGLLPHVPRLLRNVPVAQRGHPFSTPELRAFFEKRTGGCSAWYAPGKEKVKLPEGSERKCAQRLRKLEKKLRKATPVPAALETFVLENVPQELPAEMDRMRGQPRLRSHGTVEKGAAGWEVNFYSETEIEGEDFVDESSVHVRCDAKGEGCQVLMAG